MFESKWQSCSAQCNSEMIIHLNQQQLADREPLTSVRNMREIINLREEGERMQSCFINRLIC
jgi:hypothetical protein